MTDVPQAPGTPPVDGPTDDWDGGWEADRARKRRAWAAMTPGQRLAWLEDALSFAAQHDALDTDRRARAARAAEQSS